VAEHSRNALAYPSIFSVSPCVFRSDERSPRVAFRCGALLGVGSAPVFFLLFGLHDSVDIPRIPRLAGLRQLLPHFDSPFSTFHLVAVPCLEPINFWPKSFWKDFVLRLTDHSSPLSSSACFLTSRTFQLGIGLRTAPPHVTPVLPFHSTDSDRGAFCVPLCGGKKYFTSAHSPVRLALVVSSALSRTSFAFSAFFFRHRATRPAQWFSLTFPPDQAFFLLNCGRFCVLLLLSPVHSERKFFTAGDLSLATRRSVLPYFSRPALLWLVTPEPPGK